MKRDGFTLGENKSAKHVGSEGKSGDRPTSIGVNGRLKAWNNPCIALAILAGREF